MRTPGARVRRLLLLSCGGTISATAPAGGAATPRLGASDLLAGLPGLDDDLEINARTFSTVPSIDLTFDDIVRLRTEIDGWIDDVTGRGAEAAGVVITHGTDTMEETAFALDLLGPTDVPIVMTGAMRNPTLPGADGVANLLGAIATASTGPARGLGVLVVFNDEIHLAATVRKAHTSSPATFVSTPLGPVGYLAEGRPRVVLRPARGSRLLVPRRRPSELPVAVLGAGLGADERLLDAIHSAGYAGLVLEGVGGGHLPGRIARSTALATLLDRIPVVVASRTRAGELLHGTYRFAGSELDLAERGLLSAGRLDAAKARVLLTLGLAAELSRPELAELFADFADFYDHAATAPDPPLRTGDRS